MHRTWQTTRTARLLLVLGLAATPAVVCTVAPVTAQVLTTDYPWLAEWDGALPALTPLAAALPAGHGLVRVAVEPGSFAAWLRGLPVRRDRTAVHSYRGRPIAAPAAAVIALDLGRGDLQQCADTLLRLHAEYLWASKQAAAAAYHFTSGDRSAWTDWVNGERFKVSGSRVQRLAGERRSADHRSYRAWLQHLFLYAGTLSLRLDTAAVPRSAPIVAGDLFVAPGSPGHTVMVLDVATAADGSRFGLIGQGYTPAQDLHVLRATWPEVRDGVWFPLPAEDGEQLSVPSWSPFPRSSARRFRLTGARGCAQAPSPISSPAAGGLRPMLNRKILDVALLFSLSPPSQKLRLSCRYPHCELVTSPVAVRLMKSPAR